MKRCIQYTLALASTVAALPQNADPCAKDPGLPTAQGVKRIWVSKICNETEQLQISEAFYDAQKLANALKSGEPTGKNQDVLDMYMGTKSSWQGDPFWPLGSNYCKIIKNNIDRDAGVYEPYGWTDNHLYIMCHHDQYFPDKSQRDCDPNTYAWTWNNPVWDNPNRGQRGIYEAGPTADFAEKQNAAGTMVIAESYTMAGLAIYLRDAASLPDFPKPAKKVLVQGAADPNDQNSEPFSGDWKPLVDFNDAQVTMGDQFGQPAACRLDTIQASNSNYLLSDGKTKTSITDIAYSLRQVLCSDKCELPAGISADNARATLTDDGNGCEISVAMPNSGEIYLRRETHAQGEEAQQCRDYTQTIFETCLIRGPNASDGWVNGMGQNQFYQGGLRKINDPASFAVKAGHPLDTSRTLKFALSEGHPLTQVSSSMKSLHLTVSVHIDIL
ncbi:hypothetical protein DM02DRAFT_658290 [Periconia macrospinosa]|uniref:Uncharacterized protein n=1 Tax=Periconia macrospinosa TaxID=97972 RepID=A0A2V1DII9_9PLEO|nr:hypothetical protein DM02DRAFT_658290 [Periconia macrospinosa]